MKLRFLKFLDRTFGTLLCFVLGLINKLQPKPTFKPENVNKILITKWIGLGDVIVSLPTIKALGTRYPNAKIAYFTTPRAAIILKGVPEINKVISYDMTGRDKGIIGFKKIIKQIKQEKFDIAVELMQRYRLPSIIHFLAGIPYRIGFNIPEQGKGWLLDKSTDYIWPLHEVVNLGRVSQLIDAPVTTDYLPKLYFPNDLTKSHDVTQALNQAKSNIIVIHLGVGPALMSRLWPVDKFIRLTDELIKKYQSTIILTGTRSDIELASKIEKNNPSHVINLVNKTTLPQLYSLFEKVDLIISMDTGPMHLAAASSTPTLGIFIASYPEKWGPYGAQHKYLYNGPEIDHDHPTQYPPRHQVKDINIDEVLNIVSIMLQNTAK